MHNYKIAKFILILDAAFRNLVFALASRNGYI